MRSSSARACSKVRSSVGAMVVSIDCASAPSLARRAADCQRRARRRLADDRAVGEQHGVDERSPGWTCGGACGRRAVPSSGACQAIAARQHVQGAERLQPARRGPRAGCAAARSRCAWPGAAVRSISSSRRSCSRMRSSGQAEARAAGPGRSSRCAGQAAAALEQRSLQALAALAPARRSTLGAVGRRRARRPRSASGRAGRRPGRRWSRRSRGRRRRRPGCGC